MREDYHSCSMPSCVRHLCTMTQIHTRKQFLQLTVAVGIVLEFIVFDVCIPYILSVFCVFVLGFVLSFIAKKLAGRDYCEKG